MEEKQYPSEFRIAWHSIKAMSWGWLAQILTVILGYGMMGLPSNESVQTYLGIAQSWALCSGVVVFLAWLVVYMPCYNHFYRSEQMFASLAQFVIFGGAVGFAVALVITLLVGFGAAASMYAGLAALTGAVAAASGYRLRQKTLARLNPEGYSPRKTGPLKILKTP